MATSPAPLNEEKRVAVSKIELRAIAAYEHAMAMHVDSAQRAVEASAFLNEVVNNLIKEGDELFEPMIASAYQTHQISLATKKKAVGNMPAAKKHLRDELGRWAQLVEDIARAERLRIEREARAREAQQIEREIEAVEAEAHPDAAAQIEAILEAPRADLTLAPAALATSKVPGAIDVYAGEVVNPREFYRGIADGRTSASLATPNQGAIDRMAGAMKEGFNIPGCRLIKTKSVRSAARTK